MRARQLLLPFVLATLAYASACISSTLKPVELYPEDMCSRCKMAISDKRFAGEILVEVGVASKFDDLGCMIKTMKERLGRGDEPPGFAVDFGTRRWVNVKKAYYVQSSSITTPMGSGLIAFAKRSDAEQAAGKYGAKVLNYEQVFHSSGMENKSKAS